MRSRAAGVVVAALAVAACASDPDAPASAPSPVLSTSDEAATSTSDDAVSSPTAAPTTTSAPSETSAPTTVAPTSASSVPPQPPAANDTGAMVASLAYDQFGGRNNLTEGSTLAQGVLIDALSDIAEPAFANRSGDDGFRQEFPEGANIVAIIPGAQLADEWVIVGAHYDHLGAACRRSASSRPDDQICNGATDNAAGVAAALAVASALAVEGPPQRSVLVALWDAEEDGLLGSAAYIADPIVPLDRTVAYLNFDIQGAVLLPSLNQLTFVIGAETGGAPAIELGRRIAEESTLDVMSLSVLFGLGRSDHANFVRAGVPSVFFADSTSGCYHTVDDAIDVVDFDKLDQQIRHATRLTAELASGEVTPEFDDTAPATTFDDAVTLSVIGRRALADIDRFGPSVQAELRGFAEDLDDIVTAGAGAYGPESANRMLSGAAAFIDAVANSACDTGGG